MKWEEYKAKLRKRAHGPAWEDGMRECPNCRSPLHEYADPINGGWSEWCDECGYGKDDAPSPVTMPEHPDPWMDNEPGTLTVPKHWASEGPQFPPDQEFPPDINACSRCGNDMGQGMTGFDKETNQPICLNCWREGHPEGVSHPNLGFEVLPIGDPRANLPQHNDPRWS